MQKIIDLIEKQIKIYQIELSEYKDPESIGIMTGKIKASEEILKKIKSQQKKFFGLVGRKLN
jgi:hypothetical protein